MILKLTFTYNLNNAIAHPNSIPHEIYTHQGQPQSSGRSSLYQGSAVYRLPI
ncbi:hypothetical protein [Coleofasciculus sp. E2-BRE-01]|uniref:hypothetical protein n=1 Tax=Coleofasciculus sp. E2-BRE-01 TaxID=3069524 RepID=UPI004063D23E